MRNGRMPKSVTNGVIGFRPGSILAACFIASLGVMSSSASTPPQTLPAGLVRTSDSLDAAVPGDSPAIKPPHPRPDGSPAPNPLARPPLPPGHPSIETGGLDELFQQLHDARSEDDAKPIDALIQVRMLRSGSATVDLLMDRALAAVQSENRSLAFDLLDSVIALKPDYAEGWNKRATLYFLAHDYGKAISDVEMVLRLQPRHYRALIGLAGMLNELGDKAHALAALKRVIAIYPTNSDVAKDIADLEAAIGGQSL